MTAPRKRTVSVKCEHGVPRRYEVTGKPQAPALSPIGKQACDLCAAYEQGYRDGAASRPISYTLTNNAAGIVTAGTTFNQPIAKEK